MQSVTLSMDSPWVLMQWHMGLQRLLLWHPSYILMPVHSLLLCWSWKWVIKDFILRMMLYLYFIIVINLSDFIYSPGFYVHLSFPSCQVFNPLSKNIAASNVCCHFLFDEDLVNSLCDVRDFDHDVLFSRRLHTPSSFLGNTPFFHFFQYSESLL